MMTADGIRTLYAYHFALNRRVWDRLSLSDISRVDIPARYGEHAGIMCTRTQEQPAWLDT